MSLLQPAFVPLSEFWSNFFEMSTRAAPPLGEDANLTRYLGDVFGELTKHHFDQLDRVPFSILCNGCRNNNAGRKKAVCDTHMGVLKGVFQAMTHVPLEASFQAKANEECHITLNVARKDGCKTVAHALRLPHASLNVQPGGVMLVDARTGMSYPLAMAAATVLAALNTERTPEEIASLTRIPEADVRVLLDQCYNMNWISCRYDVP